MFLFCFVFGRHFTFIMTLYEGRGFQPPVTSAPPLIVNEDVRTSINKILTRPGNGKNSKYRAKSEKGNKYRAKSRHGLHPGL